MITLIQGYLKELLEYDPMVQYEDAVEVLLFLEVWLEEGLPLLEV